MPKLLQINTCITQSTGRIAQQIGERVIADGWSSYIAFPARASTSQSKSHLVKIGSRADQYFHALLSRLFDCCGFLSRRATGKLIKQIELLKPDVIQLHNLHGYYVNLPDLFKYLKESGIPVVWTLHDCWAFTGHCVHYTCVDCSRWETECHDCPRKKSYPKSFVFDRSRQNFRAKVQAYSGMSNLTIVTVSNWLGKAVGRSVLSSQTIHTIQNGVDLGVFYPRAYAYARVRKKYGLEGKYVVIGVATGWSEEVGLSTFIWLREQLPSDVAIMMVGCTPDIMKILPAGIIPISRTNNVDELAELYSSADILFNGSYQETFGLVTAEALSCGTPVIVYDSTACPEIVTPETGYVVETKNTDQVLSYILADKMLDDSIRATRRITCRQYAERHFDKDEKFLEYEHLYNELIDNEK